MKFLSHRSRALLVRMFVAYAGVSLLLLITPARWTGPVRSVALYPFALGQRLLGGAASKPHGLAGRLAGMWRAESELRVLQASAAEMRAALSEERERRQDAESRLAQLGHLPDEIRRRSVPAALRGCDLSPLRRSALFDAGGVEGIVPGAPVLWNGLLAGRVESAGAAGVRALLVGDPECRIAVRCERSRVQGVLQGLGGGLCIVKYVPATADVQPGDVFLTSDIGRLIPSGLVVGDCSEATAETGSPFRWIVVKPAVDASRIEHVALLLEE